MVRPAKNHHHQEEEEDDEDFISRTTDGSSQKDGRRNDQKASSHRSKHSETEQRRRSKINERFHKQLEASFPLFKNKFLYTLLQTNRMILKICRFQILRDLIPQNDQKRDRASFLLEVIQYIQFLQEKLHVYEGTYHGWSPEPTKLMPWRGNGVTDNFADQSQPIKNGSVDEGTIVFPQTFVAPELSAFTTTDHHVAAARTAALDMQLHQNPFDPDPDPDPDRTHEPFSNVDLLVSQSRLQQPWIDSCSVNEVEEGDSISDAYSKGLLSNLTHALGSSGVDLSQASISVQFDIRKGTSSGSTSTSFGIKEHDFLTPSNQGTGHCGIRSRDDVYDQAHKRLRTQQYQ